MKDIITIVVLAVIAVVAWVKVGILGSQRRRNPPAAVNTTAPAPRPAQNPAPRRDSVNETGPMVYYATRDYGCPDKEYRFNYKKVGNSWRAYILRTPSFGNRDTSSSITHRHWDGNRPYVCWDRSVATLSDMQAISRVWADNIQNYIATGSRFG